MIFNKMFLVSHPSCVNGLRSIRTSSGSYQNDPIQKIFLEKLRQYKDNTADGSMFEPTPEIEQELESELQRINKQFGGDGTTDMTKIPDFVFPEVKIDPLFMDDNKKPEN